MPTARRIATCLLIAVVALAATAGAPPVEPAAIGKPAAIGEQAPDFTLVDLDGVTHRLSLHRGRFVVLEWISPDCPFTAGGYREGVVARTRRRMKEMGAGDHVYLAVNSTGTIPREAVVERTRTFLQEHEQTDVPVLVDHDGTVGRRYGARRTPQVFVIDRDGILRYHGAYTNNPSGRNQDARNHVLETLDQLIRGQTVAPEHVVPWGCGVKYRKKGH